MDMTMGSAMLTISFPTGMTPILFSCKVAAVIILSKSKIIVYNIV